MEEEKKSEMSFFKILNRFFKSEKSKKLIFPLGILGVFLIFASSFLNHNKSFEANKRQNIDPKEYTEKMQQKIENLVSNIEGAGKSQVLITLENGSETVYAREEKKQKESSEDKEKNELSKLKTSDDTQTKYITVKNSDGTEKALPIKELEPTVKGVAIVCEGGSKKKVRKKIIETVKTVLNITEKKVYVTH
ncbi:MAG: hypothetical protein LBF33_02775 [Oscillospiraceae bacterium]|jgi:stage III sporulation protein AG|nr:hypothetical protein [Oscillospiraceae bacterium]